MGIGEILKLQRRQLAALIEQRGVKRLQGIYNQAQAELSQKLRSLEIAGRGKEFTAHHVRLMLAQVAAAIRQFEEALGAHMATTGRLVATTAPKHLVTAIKTMEKHFSGHVPTIHVEQAAVFQRIYREVEPSLLDRYAKSKKLYGPPVVAKVRDQLSLALVQGDTIDQAVDRVAGTSGIFTGQRWRAERIVRTEMSFSYGIANQQAMKEIAHTDVPDLYKKLIATFDDRTGEDSKELHGQVVRWDQPFAWHVRDSAGKLTGQVVNYMQPPNRPNDRECVVPWRPSWQETRPTEAV